MQNFDSSALLTLAAILVGAIVAFFIIRKIVKFVLTVLIVTVLAVVILVVCVQLGYVSRETADKINPFDSEAVRGTVKEAGNWAERKVHDAGSWAGKKAADAAEKAMQKVVSEKFGDDSDD